MSAQLKNLVIDRIDLVDRGANPMAHVVLVKRDVKKGEPDSGSVHVNKPVGEEHDDEYEDSESGKMLKATLSSGERNALPDSAFAAVWTDKDGKKQRKFPFKHKDGSVDLPHLRNALARMEQNPQVPADVKAKAKSKLQAAAKTHQVGEQNKRSKNMPKNLMKRFLALLAKEAEAAADGQMDGQDGNDGEDGASGPDGAKLPNAHLKYLKALHGHLGQMIDATKGADGSHDHLPPEHPIHKIKDVHKAVGEMLAAYGKQPGDGDPGSWDDVPNDGGPDPFGREPKENNEATKRLAKRVSDLQADVKKAQEELKAERDARATEATGTELRKFRGVSIDPSKDVALFKGMKDSNPEGYRRVMEILGAADETIKTSKLFSEVGSSREGDATSGSAWAKIEAEADGLIQKDGKLTKAKAIDLVMKRRPDLVRQHLAESK